MRPDRLELREDRRNPPPHRRPLPGERLGELAMTHPEETGHLMVELASAFPGRGGAYPLRRRANPGAAAPASWDRAADPACAIRVRRRSPSAASVIGLVGSV